MWKCPKCKIQLLVADLFRGLRLKTHVHALADFETSFDSYW